MDLGKTQILPPESLLKKDNCSCKTTISGLVELLDEAKDLLEVTLKSGYMLRSEDTRKKVVNFLAKLERE